MPPGSQSASWPTRFNNNIDASYTTGSVINGYFYLSNTVGGDRYVQDGRFKKTNKVGLIKGRRAGYSTNSTPYYVVSLWTAITSLDSGDSAGYYVRGSTYDYGEAYIDYDRKKVFETFSKLRNNNFPILDYSTFATFQNAIIAYGRGDVAQGDPTSVSTRINPGNDPEGQYWWGQYLKSKDEYGFDLFPVNAAGLIASPGGTGGGTRGGTGGGTGGGTNDTSTSTAYAQDSAVRLVVRMPIGYAGVAKSESRSPGFIQTWQEEDGKIYTEEFKFRYIPQNVKYDGLASEWVEIPRAENIPFVDWSKWQLMKVSMSFLIASDRVEPGGQTVPDGMQTAVEPEIQKLRQMAQRKAPITFINMDELLTVQLRRGTQLGRGLEFVINDMSVTATRRVTDFTDGYAGVPSGISVAQVEMTFTEVPVEKVSLVYLPPIGAPALPVPRTPQPTGTLVEYDRNSRILTGGPSRTTNVYTDDAATAPGA